MKVAMIALNRLNCYYLLLQPGLRHEGDELMEPLAGVDKPQVHQIVLLDSKLLYLLKTADKTGKLHVQLSNYVKELFLSSRTKHKCKAYYGYIHIYIHVLLLKDKIGIFYFKVVLTFTSHENDWPVRLLRLSLFLGGLEILSTILSPSISEVRCPP